MNNRLIADYVIQNRERHYRLAYSYVKNPDDALDVVQESVCKAILSAHTLKSPDFLKNWYYRIIVNTALDLLRNQKKLMPLDEDAFADLSFNESHPAQSLDLHEALDRLPDHYRIMVVLRFFEDMTLYDIAEVTGVNLSTVKTRLYKALKLMRLTIENEEKGGTEYGL